MLKHLLTMTAATTVLASGTAFAEESLSEKAGKAAHMSENAVMGTSINKIGEKGDVTISGKVAFIDTIDNEFTLQDSTGKIDVEQTGDLAVSVGDEVTVSGTITSDLGEKEIAASKVTVTKQAPMKDDRS